MKYSIETQTELYETQKAVLAALKTEVERKDEMSSERVVTLAEALKAL